MVNVRLDWNVPMEGSWEVPGRSHRPFHFNSEVVNAHTRRHNSSREFKSFGPFGVKSIEISAKILFPKIILIEKYVPGVKLVPKALNFHMIRVSL